MLSTEVLCFYSVSAVLEKNSYYAYRDSAEVHIYDAIISKILFLLVCKICSNFKIKNNNKTYRAPISYYVYTISSFSLILCLIFINGQYKFNSSLQLFIVASATFLLFSLIFIFISYEKSARKNAEIVELKTETQKQKLDEKYYQILQSQNESMHTFAHDTKHHLFMIKNLSEDEAIHQYINSIYKDIEKYSIVGKTQNKTLDIILNEYQTLCDIKNIEFETDIKTANLNYIEPNKLTSLLTNILDNAIEATEKCDNKKIQLSINNIDNFDVLTCINSCNFEPEIIDGYIKTTKPDKGFHGYGTKSIAKIVKFYNGTLRYEYKQDNGDFILTIILPKQ
jgi:sensor histidine kinase regulating citrate/malate metabolism